MLFVYLRKPANQVKKAGKTEGRWEGFVAAESPFSLWRSGLVL